MQKVYKVHGWPLIMLMHGGWLASNAISSILLYRIKLKVDG